MDGNYTDAEIKEWEEEIRKGPPKWEDLPEEVKEIRNDEVLLKAMLIHFKEKKRMGDSHSEYIDLMIRLISSELEEPRL